MSSPGMDGADFFSRGGAGQGQKSSGHKCRLDSAEHKFAYFNEEKFPFMLTNCQHSLGLALLNLLRNFIFVFLFIFFSSFLLALLVYFSREILGVFFIPYLPPDKSLSLNLADSC